MVLCIASVPITAAIVATQMVTLDIFDQYTGIASIRVFDGTTVNPTVTFSDSYQGTYQTSDAGSEAWKSNYAEFESLTEKSGGSLQYTIANLSDQKITVHAGTSGYNSESLYVKIGEPRNVDGYIATNTLGLRVDSGNASYPEKFNIMQGSGSAKTVIDTIPGANTYTGTAFVTLGETDYLPGASVTYGFDGDPGVGSISVTYTLLQDGTTTASF